MPEPVVEQDKRIQYVVGPMGADPEFFFRDKDGNVVESRKVLPPAGVRVGSYKNYPQGNLCSKVIVDGVQAEFNPYPTSCREGIAGEYSRMFNDLLISVLKPNELTVDFSSGIDIPKEQLKELRPESRMFGCMPSLNAYTIRPKQPFIRDGFNFTFRPAGGHIHIGKFKSTGIDGSNSKMWNDALDNHKELVKVLDVVCGVPCVLVDRDPNVAKRRQFYGRAGEYRLPKHGVEYRVLSNFWLKNYVLMSMAYGFIRVGVMITGQGMAKELLSLVNKSEVRQAINENDFGLALKIFKQIDPFIREYTNPSNNYLSLTNYTLDLFYHFISKPLEYWFKNDLKDPVDHWVDYNNNPKRGWERFLSEVVKRDKIKGGEK